MMMMMMMTAAEIESLLASAQALQETLRRLADFRAFPTLLDQTEPEVQAFLDHVVAAVRDARELNGEVLAGLEQAFAEATTEPEPEAAEAPAGDEPEPPRHYEPPASIEQITMANPTGLREVVLIAESSPEVLQAAEDILTEEDYRVISVRDGFEAIATYGRLWTAIDLVMLDFDLPGLSGELVFEELLAINPKVAVVVSSGFSAPEKGKFHQMLARGLAGFAPKPFERERLIRQIQSILAHRQTR